DWPNTYRQPDAVRTYVSLNHNLYSNGFPWSIPLAHRRAVTTAVLPQIRTVWLESSWRSYVTVPALASSSRSAFVYMRPFPVTSTKSSARMRSIVATSLFRTAVWYSLSSAATAPSSAPASAFCVFISSPPVYAQSCSARLPQKTGLRAPDRGGHGGPPVQGLSLFCIHRDLSSRRFYSPLSEGSLTFGFKRTNLDRDWSLRAHSDIVRHAWMENRALAATLARFGGQTVPGMVGF